MYLKLKLSFFSTTKIGPYGPFQVDSYFAFSDFENWGETNNSDFKPLIEDCIHRKTIIDIGAHIGLISMPISKIVSKNSFVHAIEPGTINNYYLKKHIKRNNIRNVKTYELLLGEKTQKDAVFYEKKIPSGLNSVIKIDGKGSFISKKINQLTLDDFCKRFNLRPDLIKVDIEGMEYNVLKGGVKIIKECKPLIYLSYHRKYLEKIGIKKEDFFKLLNSINYYSNINLNEFANTEVILKSKK